MAERVNCWQHHQCGREPGGRRAVEDGPCPAAIETSCDGINRGRNAGRLCWGIEGTPCAPGAHDQKMAVCERCSFFRRVKYEEGGRLQLLMPGLSTSDPAALHRLLNNTLLLTGIGRDILGQLAMHPLLVHVAEYARSVTGAVSAGVYLPAESGAAWRLEAHAGPFDRAERIERDEPDLVAEAARARALCKDVTAVSGAPQPLSVMALPLPGHEQPAGVLELVKAGERFTADDEWFLREMSLMAGLSIQNARYVADLRELRDLDKAKSRFVALLMHQLGSPLATVACSLTALSQLGDRLKPEDRDQLITCSLERIASVQALKRKLLDLAAIRSGQHLAGTQAVSPAEALRQEVEAAALRAEQEGLRLNLHLPEQEAPVRADLDGLRLIFSNLLSNAIKYSAGRGETIEVTLTADADVVRVAVRDQGIGIPPEEQVRLFEEFHRAKNAQATGAPGTGLGLTFVHELVTRYNGRIEVDSTVGEGTTMTVAFPTEKSGE